MEEGSTLVCFDVDFHIAEFGNVYRRIAYFRSVDFYVHMYIAEFHNISPLYCGKEILPNFYCT
jgi:hypothetical protein